MSRVFELIELLEHKDFCDYIQEWANMTGRSYDEVYNEVLDNNIFAESMVDGYLRSRGIKQL